LGHRQVRHRPPSCKSAQVARGIDLPQRNSAADIADDWNLLSHRQLSLRRPDQWPKGKREMTARTPAPKTNDYSLVPGSLGPRRDFRISVGLREGWDADGRVFDVSEAVRTARAWMKRRVEAGQPALSGMFTRAEVTYAWPRPDGTVGSDREPVALFTGEAVHAYLGHLPDETIEAMLNELSIELGVALGQERIYVAFADRTWILDAGER
jgi:hypothetical protein